MPGKAPRRPQNPDSSRARAVRTAHPATAWSSKPPGLANTECKLQETARRGSAPRCSSDPLPASPGCQGLFLLRPGRYDTVGARIGDRLAEVLMLVREEVADGTFLGEILAEQFHRRLQVGVRESLDGFLQVCVGVPQRFLHFFRLEDLRSAPAARALTCAGERCDEEAVLLHDQVEDV